MKHGEQLAPLIEQALREAGLVRQDLTAIAVGVGPGPFTGLRVGLVTARTLGFVLEIPVTACARSTCSRSRPSDTGAVDGEFVGGDRRPPQGGLPRDVRRARRPPRRAGRRPARRRRDRRRRWSARARPSTPTPSRAAVGPAAPSAGWLARVVAEERAELRDPEPLYLRRPDAAPPGAPKRVS